MLIKLKEKLYKFLHLAQKHTGTDMIYLARGGFWITSGQIVLTASGLLLSVTFANLLSQETFGIYKYVISMAGILAIPTLGSMGTAIIQAISRGYEGSLIPALKIKIKFGILGGVASLFFAGYYYFNDNSTLAIAFLISSFFIPLISSFSIYGSLLVGRKEFKTSTKYKVITELTSVSILILSAVLTENVFVILMAYFLPKNLLNYFFFKIVLNKFKPNKKQDARTIPFGIHLSLLGITVRIVENIDKIIIWHSLGPIQLAIYSFAIMPIQQISGIITGNISLLSLPKLSNRSSEELKKSLPPKIFKLFIIIIPLIILYIFLAPYFFKILYPKYLESIVYSRLFALSLVFVPISLLGHSLVAKMRTKEITILRVLSQPFQIILMLILAPLYGIWGVIWAILLGNIFNAVLVSFLFMKMKK